MNKKIKTLLVFAMEDVYKSKNRNIPMLGIAYLQSSIQKAGFYCKRIDPFKNNYIFKKNDIVNEIIVGQYDVIGFSILECNCQFSLEMATTIKKMKPTVKILFGGIYATIMNERLLEHTCVDVVMRGEGELAIVELIKDLQTNGDFTKNISGCSYRMLNGGKRVSDKINYLDDLNNDIYPNRDEYDKYSSMEIDGIKKSLIPISSSRGCPFACSFCSVSMLNSRWRARSANNVINEIDSIYQKDKNIVIVFIDDNFFVIPKRSLQIMQYLKSKNIKFIFATRVEQLIRAKNYLKKIKDCGCISIELGIENGSDSMLYRFNKKTTVKNNIEALSLCTLNNLSVSIDFITFDNETSIEELKENIIFFKQAGLWGKYPIFFYNRVYPYEGTRYFHIIKDPNKYFVHSQVDLVYNKLMQFGSNYQPVLDQLYNILFCKKFKTIQEKLDFVLVKTLPYIIFENLVMNSGNYDIHQYGNTIELLRNRYIKEDK